MATIRIDLNTKKTPTWKLGEASIIFTDEDGPLMSGLVLTGFTIGSTPDPTKVNITPPSRPYKAVVTDDTGKTSEVTKQWAYIRPTDFTNKDRMSSLYTAIADAYFRVIELAKD